MAYIKTSWKLTLWYTESLWTYEKGVQLTFTIDATAHAFGPSGSALRFFNINTVTPKSKCRYLSFSTRGLRVPQITREKRWIHFLIIAIHKIPGEETRQQLQQFRAMLKIRISVLSLFVVVTQSHSLWTSHSVRVLTDWYTFARSTLLFVH